MCVCLEAVHVRERVPRKNEERDACMSKIRGCVWVRDWKKLCLAQRGVRMHCVCVCVCVCVNSVEWQRWAFFSGTGSSVPGHEALVSFLQALFAHRCERYRLLELVGFLPAICLILPFMCALAKSEGAAWHTASSTQIPGFDPLSFLYPSCLLQYSCPLWHSSHTT